MTIDELIKALQEIKSKGYLGTTSVCRWGEMQSIESFPDSFYGGFEIDSVEVKNAPYEKDGQAVGGDFVSIIS